MTNHHTQKNLSILFIQVKTHPTPLILSLSKDHPASRLTLCHWKARSHEKARTR